MRKIILDEQTKEIYVEGLICPFRQPVPVPVQKKTFELGNQGGFTLVEKGCGSWCPHFHYSAPGSGMLDRKNAHAEITCAGETISLIVEPLK